MDALPTVEDESKVLHRRIDADGIIPPSVIWDPGSLKVTLSDNHRNISLSSDLWSSISNQIARLVCSRVNCSKTAHELQLAIGWRLICLEPYRSPAGSRSWKGLPLSNSSWFLVSKSLTL